MFLHRAFLLLKLCPFELRDEARNEPEAAAGKAPGWRGWETKEKPGEENENDNEERGTRQRRSRLGFGPRITETDGRWSGASAGRGGSGRLCACVRLRAAGWRRGRWRCASAFDDLCDRSCAVQKTKGSAPTLNRPEKAKLQYFKKSRGRLSRGPILLRPGLRYPERAQQDSAPTH